MRYLKIMLVTLDTNVLYQSLYSNLGASHFILQKVGSGEIQIAISVPVFNEYEDVLTRDSSLKNFELDKKDVEKFLRFIAYIGRAYNTYFLFRPNLTDEADNMFIELAVTSGSDYIVTNNIKDFKNAELKFDGLGIITPSEFVKKWRGRYAKSKRINHKSAF